MQNRPIRHFHVSHLSVLLLLLNLITASLAITAAQLQTTFNIHYPSDTAPGGCARDALIGKPMWDRVVASATDAFQMASTVQYYIDSYFFEHPYQDRMRQCLFLFFGIKFQNDHRLSPESVDTFIYVKRMRLLIAKREGSTDQLDRGLCESVRFFE